VTNSHPKRRGRRKPANKSKDILYAILCPPNPLSSDWQHENAIYTEKLYEKILALAFYFNAIHEGNEPEFMRIDWALLVLRMAPTYKLPKKTGRPKDSEEDVMAFKMAILRSVGPTDKSWKGIYTKAREEYNAYRKKKGQPQISVNGLERKWRKVRIMNNRSAKKTISGR
jgi:hypothetical protein